MHIETVIPHLIDVFQTLLNLTSLNIYCKPNRDVMTEDNMMSNAEANATIDDSSARDFEDDFM